MAGDPAVSETPADLSNPAAYADPRLECDIVMKGGVTSGVVYPRAVAELARRYRFRSVGGTSAGAIAAVGVAAAEYRRSRDGGRGFAHLAAVPDQLAQTTDGRTRLLSLFRPEPGTRALFDAALVFTGNKPRGRLRAMIGPLREFRSRVGAAAAIGALALLTVAIAIATVHPRAVVAFALGAVTVLVAVLIVAAAAVTGVVADVRRRLPQALAENAYGLCKLGVGGPTGSEALTPWLHQQVQKIAGRPSDEPLTMGDLWGSHSGGDCPVHGQRCPHVGETAAERRIRLRGDPECRVVNLELVTTNLTFGRPIRLPVLQESDGRYVAEGGLLFDPDEFVDFFPEHVVSALVHGSGPPSENLRNHLAAATKATPPVDIDRLRHFPLGETLPVVVAARMSLSFPGLISALPFWKLVFLPNKQPPRLVRVWCSDGGITSNFPVHFFDRVLPTRPTFAINLSGFGPGERRHETEPCSNVRHVDKVSDEGPERPQRIDSVAGFALAVKDAAQNWRDNAQAALPGYRERVVHVMLDRGEGGLNLAMTGEQLRDLAERGECAGRALVKLFSGDPNGGTTANLTLWNDHRFARVRVTLGRLERLLKDLVSAYKAQPDAVTIAYDLRVQQGEKTPPYRWGPYDRPEEAANRRAVAERAIADYVALVERWSARGETLDDEGLPRPRPELRMVPRV